jgi:nicotinate-nucleotide adenylyltransferase
MSTGVLGGTFDPIHNGHLAIADEAAVKLGLKRVLFVPAGDPWLKEQTNVTAAAHRLEMLKLVLADKPHFGVSTVDLERPGPSYTEDTLADLTSQLGDDAPMYFILGIDALAEFERWRNPERILQMCTLVAVRRPGALAVDMTSLEQRVPGISRRLVLLDNQLIDISSTDIRRRVASGLTITGLVPAAVERYITEQRLYQVTPRREG